MTDEPGPKPPTRPAAAATEKKPEPKNPKRPPEAGGPRGPEPTRYGDWEKRGRCIDF